MSNILSKKQLIVANVLIALIIAFFVFLTVMLVIINNNNDPFDNIFMITSFPLRWSLFLGSAAGLAVSYSLMVIRNGITLRIRQVYAGIILSIICTFVFSCYQVYQDTQLIKDVACTRYSQAIEQKQHEIGYELRPRFTKHRLSSIATCMRIDREYFTIQISLGAREAKIFPYPHGGSLVKGYILEQADHKWYVRGESVNWQR